MLTWHEHAHSAGLRNLALISSQGQKHPPPPRPPKPLKWLKTLSFRRGRGHPDGPSDGRLVQPHSEKADVHQKGIRAGVLVSENLAEKKKMEGVFDNDPASRQSQDPGAGAAAAWGGGGAPQAAGETR